ncbi:MAG: glycosyltransferase [Rhodococcus sp. (in: high G+C Gram-positive bacteria)]|uniref:glycosyltransferase n=1 Tax=Rhodococcus sp. TaxID=1831 RepID=UPI003BB01D1B
MISTKRSIAIIGTRGYPSYYGGFETLIRHLAPFLAEQGWDVTVYSRPGATVPDDPARDHRVGIRNTVGFESQSLSTLSYGLSSCLDSAVKKPDVALVLNVANGFFLPLLKARGIPTVVNVDGIEWEREKWGTRARQVFRAGARMTARHATRLVVDSHEIKRRWENDFQRVGDFIPYGGDVVEKLSPIGGLTPKEYVLMVARFVPENTVAEFFEAAEVLSRERDVVIVGSSGYGGELDEQARDLAARNDRVKWLGHVSDDEKLFSLWQNAGAYFHGHSVGGTNPALVQAMACSAPIVARDTVYNREVLGNAGKFVEAEASEIVTAVTDLIDDSAGQQVMSDRAVQRAFDHYTWEDVCQRYEETLLAAIG